MVKGVTKDILTGAQLCYRQVETKEYLYALPWKVMSGMTDMLTDVQLYNREVETKKYLYATLEVVSHVTKRPSLVYY